jgi:hypothetical protein
VFESVATIVHGPDCLLVKQMVRTLISLRISSNAEAP